MIFWAFLAMLVDIGLARFGYGLLLPQMRADLGGAYGVYGTIATLHFAGYLAGSLAGPFILRRDRGAGRTAAIAHLFVALGLAASAAASGVFMLGIARVVIGFAAGVGIVSVFSATMERVAPAQRGRISGIVWSGLAVGLLLSAIPTPWLLVLPGGWRIGTYAAAALGAVCAVGLAISMRVAATPSGGTARAATWTEQPFVLRDLLDPRRFLLLAAAYGCGGAAYTAYATFAVAALRLRGMGGTEIAFVWAALGLTGVIGALAVGPLLASRLQRATFAFTFTTGTIGCALTALPSLSAAIGGALFAGLSMASMPAVATAFARARASTATGPAAFTAVTMVFGVGQIVGPYSGGLLADHSGPATVAWLACAFYAGGGVLAIFDGLLRPPPAI